jgi:hypothetical protein
LCQGQRSAVKKATEEVEKEIGKGERKKNTVYAQI